jgi:hypothetical protein
MALFIFLVGVSLSILLVEWVSDIMGMNIILLAFLGVSIIFVGLFFILIELPIALALTIDDKKIVVRNLLTRKSQEYLLEDFHGFKISILMRGYRGFYLDLILLRHGEALEPISLQYIGNLDEIIKALEKHLRNLTDDEYGFLRYIRERQIN